jgi:hypothetical protein
MTTSNATPKAQALAQRRRAITTPASSEGHASDVRIQRNVGERQVGLWAEGIPYRHLAERRRVQPITAEPLLMRAEASPLRAPTRPQPSQSAPTPKGCATGTACMGHPDCADTKCQGHPDNSDEQKAFDLRGKDYSDYHGPISREERALRAKVWRAFLAGVALFVVVVASVLWN